MANNMEYAEFPSDFIHGLLCKHLCTNDIDDPDSEFRLLNTNWIVIEMFQEINAVLFADHKNKDLILVFKNFDCLKSDEMDKLVEKCKKTSVQINLISKKLNYNISFTGFLNGAHLAEYCNYFSLHLANNEQTKAILFESPHIN